MGSYFFEGRTLTSMVWLAECVVLCRIVDIWVILVARLKERSIN